MRLKGKNGRKKSLYAFSGVNQKVHTGSFSGYNIGKGRFVAS